MKNIIFFFMMLFSVSAFSQIGYDQQWKQIENNYAKGLYKDNLPIINAIQKQAMKDNNAVQIIKSLQAEFSIINDTQDDPENNAASLFFEKIENLQNQLKGNDLLVYSVISAEFIKEYYNNNSWEINERTNINNPNSKEIETWSKADYKNYLTHFYNQLFTKSDLLKKIQMQGYKEAFELDNNFEFAPTLYDWAMHQEIKFLQNDGLFTPNEIATNRQVIIDKYNALIATNTGNTKLYNQHQLINFECDATHCENKYEQLENLFNQNQNNDYALIIVEEMMDILQQKKQSIAAIEWGEKAMKLFPNSPYIKNVNNTLQSIKNPTLILKYQQQVQSNLPIYLSATSKNVDQFTLNIYKVEDQDSFLRFIFDSYRNPFEKLKKKLYRKDNISLKNPKDYQIHTSATAIQPLASGMYVAEYVVDGSSQGNFHFFVSDVKTIGYQKNIEGKKQDVLLLINSENGKPIASQDLQFTQYSYEKIGTVTRTKTNKDGTFMLPPQKDDDYYQNYLLKSGENYSLISINGDSYYVPDNQSERGHIQIFMDRLIFRPGQTIYFKAVSTIFDPKTNQENVAKNQKITVTLYDENSEQVITKSFTTNDYGSINGSFVLPKGKLNGSYYLQAEAQESEISGEKSFYVEEYKRPKFEVTFEKIKEEYQYGETVEIKGKAMMFSGVPLSNTPVSFEIIKQNIRWKYFWWFPAGDNNQNSILGSATTNDKGEFTIKVQLQKNENIKGIQIDNYHVEATITDINGESQSASTSINVASVSHYITAESIADTFSDTAITTKISVNNYNDEPLQKAYHVKLEKLKAPNRVLRSIFEEEIQTLSIFPKSEFLNLFPHDRYDISEKQENWQSEKTIINGTEKNEKDLQLGTLNPGTYRLEIYNIEKSDTIKTVQYFTVWDRKKLDQSQYPFLKVIRENGQLMRGQTEKYYIYSAIPDAAVYIYRQIGDGKTSTELRHLKDGLLVYTTEVPKDNKIISFNIQFQLAAYNDVQSESFYLDINDSQKQLSIETTTFRDKIQPGEKETWSVKISGEQKEKVEAELLASMYDMSLDKFFSNTFVWDRVFRYSPIFYQYQEYQSLLSAYYAGKYSRALEKKPTIPQFNWFGGGNNGYPMMDMAVAEMSMNAPPIGKSGNARNKMANQEINEYNYEMADAAKATDAESGGNSYKDLNGDNVQIRQNFNETAFFYPNLLTDKEGNVSFQFTAPEALTKWKLLFLAHTKDARAATLEKQVITQKEFSVTPNYPRFLRIGDQLTLQSKISSLKDEKMSGTATLQILDAVTNEDISHSFNLRDIQKSFNLEQNGNTTVSWQISVPENISSVLFKIIAKAGNFSDGEQQAVAILPNKMLVTDAIPVFVKQGQEKTFTLENLKNLTSVTATNVATTLELTTNPIWEIMFALPSLQETNENSADSYFNKWFADVVSSEIYNANPKLKAVFQQYSEKDLLKSNLEKNQELKQLLLEETPWVLESKNETEQMQRIALLFDTNTMMNATKSDWQTFANLQNPDGSFSWYAGYPGSYSVSLYILKNLGKINNWIQADIINYQTEDQQQLVQNLIDYVDNQINIYWKNQKNKDADFWNNLVLDYLDTRSYWEKKYPLKNEGKLLKELVIKKAATADIKDFTFFGLYRAAILLDTYNQKSVSQKLLTYLKQTSTNTETQGVYWKQNLNDWGWYTSKTINHAGALEAFQKLTPQDSDFIEELKIWLITQKEVNSWGNSRSTAEVIYTILNSGKSWTSDASDTAEIVWGGKKLQPQQEATGFVKQSISSPNIEKNLASATIKKTSPGIVQGGLYWQYYENLDKIKSSQSYLSITKEIYRKIKTENGELLEKITNETPLKVGDKVTVRMILNTDRNMEFVHLKVMRAAGLEPLDTLSGYQWNNNLGYYQVTKDASTNFYIEQMQKGKYVFEYDLVCNAAGNFSEGIATLQNYYAPEMNAHTVGSTIKIENK